MVSSWLSLKPDDDIYHQEKLIAVYHGIQVIFSGQKFLQNVIAAFSMLPAYRRHSENVVIFFCVGFLRRREGPSPAGIDCEGLLSRLS